MKFHKISLLLTFFIVGCVTYGTISAKYDSFQNATIVKMKLNHPAVEGYRSLETTYVNIIKNNKSNIKMKIMTNAGLNETEMQEKAFFSVDGKKIEVKLTNRKLSSITQTTQHYESKGAYKDYTKPTGSTSQTVNFLNGELKLSNEIANNLKSGKNILIRIYVNEDPLTFKFTEGDRKNFIKFLNTKSAKKN